MPFSQWVARVSSYVIDAFLVNHNRHRITSAPGTAEARGIEASMTAATTRATTHPPHPMAPHPMPGAKSNTGAAAPAPTVPLVSEQRVLSVEARWSRWKALSVFRKGGARPCACEPFAGNSAESWRQAQNELAARCRKKGPPVGGDPGAGAGHGV